MNIVDRLRQLLADQYGITAVELQPMPQFAVLEDRGIYRVNRAGDSPLLIRAYQQDEREGDWLTRRAATLRFLEQADYPAPRVIPTPAGALVGKDQGWDALLVSFVEGTMAGDSLDDFCAIGAALGQLHRLDPLAAVAAIPPVPPDRWQPTSLISGWIKDLTRIADQVPPDLQGVYTFSLETLSRIEQWADMPMAITHTDCWANNAIRTPSGQMVLIDWDGAGLGPAILDVGYLLIACHAFLPEWPQLIPSRERIAAVLDGYMQQRAITAAEREVLPDAIGFAEAFRAAQWMPEGMHGNWRENARFLKFLNRYPVADEIAQIAVQSLARLYQF